MMIERSRLEIYIDVLKTIRRRTKTMSKIMYSTNLSWICLKEILKTLIKQNLIEVRHVRGFKRYRITGKGLRVLGYFKEQQEELIIK